MKHQKGRIGERCVLLMTDYKIRPTIPYNFLLVNSPNNELWKHLLM